MTKPELKQQVTDVVRDTLRKEDCYSESGDALLGIWEVVDSISVDREGILEHVRQALNEGRNPLNALLGLVGLRVVSPERAVRKLSSAIGKEYGAGMIVEEIGMSTNIDSLLHIDKEKAMAAVERMALDLRGKAAADNRIVDSMRDQMETSHGELQRINADFQQLRADHQEIVHQVAAWAQRILTPDGSDPMTEKVTSLLNDMDISVYWNAEGAEFSSTAMFTTLRRAASYQGRNQPCLIKDGQILLKGILLIDEEPG